MPWAVAAAVVGAGASLYSADQNKKGQEKMGALANRQAEIGDAQYADYQKNYAPRERQMLDDAFDSRRSPAAAAARAAAEATSAGDNAQAIGLRNARKMGINPASPAYADIQREQQAGRMGMIASAKTMGRQQADDTNFNRQNTLLSAGKGLVADSLNANQSSFGMLGSLQAMQAQRDAQRGELIGAGAGYISSGLSDYMKNGTKDGSDAALDNWKPFYKTVRG